MKPTISLITLGVDDLQRSLVFYRDGMGLPTEGIIGEEFENGAVVFINMQPGLKLALWPRKSLAAETGLKSAPSDITSFTLAHNVATAEAVDQIMKQAQQAGGTIIKPADKTFYGGYAGYFKDPDGHLWEIAWNPGWTLE